MTDHLASIAIGSGRTLSDMLEFWTERAAIREHDGGQARADAERGALEDVERWLEVRR